MKMQKKTMLEVVKNNARAKILHRAHEKSLFYRGIRNESKLKLKYEIESKNASRNTKKAFKVVKPGIDGKLPDDVVGYISKWI